MENCQSFDDGDPPQKCKSKVISAWLTHIWTMCHVYGATIDVDRLFYKGNAERGSEKYFGRKEKTGNVQLRYIEDIHVMGVLIAC